jgi:MYXO-CTERM domain-containing protein
MHSLINSRKSLLSRVHGLTIGLAAAVATLTLAPNADAKGPYITLKDDGTLSNKIAGPSTVLEKVVKQYDAAGAARPDVISVWTAFPQNKNDVETLYTPASNDVTGIGLDEAYGGDGTFDADNYAPLKAVLLHNNVFALKKRAELANAPVEGFAEYLFLLELSHVWGPSVKPEGLLGFPFHWSFWMDAGGSPAGGNKWKDNGDGTFSILPQAPKDVTYSKLDLYLMGLADPSEVQPFGLLENVEPPTDVKDPYSGGELSEMSFPHFASTPVTVKATRKTITIEDIIAANGPRVPARKDAPQTLKLGIVLMVGGAADDAAIAKAEAAMEPVAAALAPAFERATGGRGHLEVVTQSTEPPPADGPSEETPGDEASNGGPAATTTTTESGCAMTSRPTSAGTLALAGLVAAALVRRRRASAR